MSEGFAIMDGLSHRLFALRMECIALLATGCFATKGIIDVRTGDRDGLRAGFKRYFLASLR